MSLPLEIALVLFVILLSLALMAVTFAISFRILKASGLDLATAALIAKALCFVTVGLFMPLTTGLAQWVNSGQWPGPLIWIVTGASCVAGAANSLLSFLSGSYSDYVSDKKPGRLDTTTVVRQETHTRTPPSPPDLTPPAPKAQTPPTTPPVNPADTKTP